MIRGKRGRLRRGGAHCQLVSALELAEGDPRHGEAKQVQYQCQDDDPHDPARRFGRVLRCRHRRAMKSREAGARRRRRCGQMTAGVRKSGTSGAEAQACLKRLCRSEREVQVEEATCTFRRLPSRLLARAGAKIPSLQPNKPSTVFTQSPCTWRATSPHSQTRPTPPCARQAHQRALHNLNEAKELYSLNSLGDRMSIPREDQHLDFGFSLPLKRMKPRATLVFRNATV